MDSGAVRRQSKSFWRPAATAIDGGDQSVGWLGYNVAMRYSLAALMFWTVMGPPLLAFAWFYAPTLAEMIAWLSIVGLFALAHWSLCRSLALDQAKRDSGKSKSIHHHPTNSPARLIEGYDIEGYGTKALDSVSAAP